MFYIIKTFLIDDFFDMLPMWTLVFIICGVIGRGVRRGG